MSYYLRRYESPLPLPPNMNIRPGDQAPQQLVFDLRRDRESIIESPMTHAITYVTSSNPDVRTAIYEALLADRHVLPTVISYYRSQRITFKPGNNNSFIGPTPFERSYITDACLDARLPPSTSVIVKGVYTKNTTF